MTSAQVLSTADFDSSMPFVYDYIYQICKNRRFLIDWLQAIGLLEFLTAYVTIVVRDRYIYNLSQDILDSHFA